MSLQKQPLLVFFLLTISFTPFAEAEMSCVELNRDWPKFHKDFGVSWALNSFKCPSQTSKLVDAYEAILESPNSFYSWSSSLIKKTIYDTACPKHQVASFSQSQGRMRLCSAFFAESDSSRAGTLIHEAAHGLLSDPGHVVCTRGVARGRRACDSALHPQGGSGYNFEARYFRSLLSLKQNHALSESLVRRSLKALVLNRFNQLDQDQVQKWLELTF